MAIDLANADDMTKQWPKSDLLSFCGFPTAARNSLCQNYWEQQDGLNLAEVFELVISNDRDPRPGYLISKMLDVRSVGKKALFAVVGHMTELDFGKQCNLVWQSKYAQFRDAHRVRGSRWCSWSFPITDEGKLMAKYRDGRAHRHYPRRTAANDWAGISRSGGETRHRS